MNKWHAFKNLQIEQAQENAEVIIQLPKDVISFMEEGCIIPNTARTGVYFMPFVFERFGNSNVFKVVDMLPAESFDLTKYQPTDDHL